VPPEPSESTQSNGHLSIPLPTDPSDIVRPLSDAVKSILDIHSDKASLAQGFELTNALARTLKNSEIIWQSKSSSNRYVAKLSSNLAVKSFRGISDFTEYTSMEFLELHKPHLPVPRPHGLITAGGSAYLFMALVPGISLNKIWPELQEEQKMDLSNELNFIFLDLRQLECPDGTPLGGPGGEGCKDTRRHTRVSEVPLYSSSEFWDFQYSGARAGSQVYLQFLRQLTSPFQARNCVFTHGDLRTENIMVQFGKDGKYRISGIIDWEMGGFYPADFECTKVTNTFATDEMEDWYLYLPWCISPARFPSKWLADLIWDSHLF
jgi:aminoglycoside phosphotransferase